MTLSYPDLTQALAQTLTQTLILTLTLTLILTLTLTLTPTLTPPTSWRQMLPASTSGDRCGSRQTHTVSVVSAGSVMSVAGCRHSSSRKMKTW